MRHAEPTGRWRHRAEYRLFRRERLVLQLEEKGLLTTYVPGRSDTQWVTRWRDATTTDLGGQAAALAEEVQRFVKRVAA